MTIQALFVLMVNLDDSLKNLTFDACDYQAFNCMPCWVKEGVSCQVAIQLSYIYTVHVNDIYAYVYMYRLYIDIYIRIFVREDRHVTLNDHSLENHQKNEIMINSTFH